jgi:hypothetical protein
LGPHSKSATEQVVGTKPALLVLMGAVGFVLLIACANSPTDVRLATACQREIAIRTAMARPLAARPAADREPAAGQRRVRLRSPRSLSRPRRLTINLPRIDAVMSTAPCSRSRPASLCRWPSSLVPAIQAARPTVQGMLKDGVCSLQQEAGSRCTGRVGSDPGDRVLIGSGLMLKSFR